MAKSVTTKKVSRDNLKGHNQMVRRKLRLCKGDRKELPVRA